MLTICKIFSEFTKLLCTAKSTKIYSTRKCTFCDVYISRTITYKRPEVQDNGLVCFVNIRLE